MKQGHADAIVRRQNPCHGHHPERQPRNSPGAMGQRTAPRCAFDSQRAGNLTSHTSPALVAVRSRMPGTLPEATHSLRQTDRLASRRRSRLADAAHDDRTRTPRDRERQSASATQSGVPSTRSKFAVPNAPSFPATPWPEVNNTDRRNARHDTAPTEGQTMNVTASPSLHEDAVGRRRDSPTPAFFRIRDVLRITGLSRPTLYRRITACRFPPPVHLGGRACGWHYAALEAWIADPEGYRTPGFDQQPLPRTRGRPRKYTV